jgi:predicted RNA binding protein YcfA (HicA-like mRNA interferase family)
VRHRLTAHRPKSSEGRAVMPELSRILGMLQRDGALDLDDPSYPTPIEPPPAETVELEYQRFELDYDRLFPSRPPARDGADYELYGDDWEIDGALTEDLASLAGSGYGSDAPPEWDVWAWYQPIHFFGPNWGIFITEDGLVECARRIAGATPPFGPGHHRNFAKATLRAAFAVLFLHEQYHHKTESAAIRMHVVEQRAVYSPYHRSVYIPAKGSSGLIEEGLASADSWRRVTESAHKRWIGPSISRATRAYLKNSFPFAPPGYSEAQHFCGPYQFKAMEERFLASVQEAQSPPNRLDVSDFGNATYLNKSLFTLKQHIWTLVPHGVPVVLPTRPGIAPLQTEKLRRLIQNRGFTRVKGEGKGSHQKYRDGGGQMIILRSEKDASLGVLKSTAAALGVNITKLEELARQI